jgi:hypothetical protein
MTVNANTLSLIFTTDRVANIRRIFAQLKKKFIIHGCGASASASATVTEKKLDAIIDTFEMLFEMSKNNNSTIGHFEWIDGTLIHALQNGDWILLENVNFCNPTVLDRLNPLLETNGVLLVNECGLQQTDGQPRIIRPHPNFRIFFTMNPKFGEISRAMRNRCIEISILDDIISISNTSNSGRRRTRTRMMMNELEPKWNDIQQLLILAGIKWPLIRTQMIQVHTYLITQFVNNNNRNSDSDSDSDCHLNTLIYVSTNNNSNNANTFELVSSIEYPFAEQLINEDTKNSRVRFTRDMIYVYSFVQQIVFVYQMKYNNHQLCKIANLSEEYMSECHMMDMAIVRNEYLLILFNRWIGIYKLHFTSHKSFCWIYLF